MNRKDPGRFNRSPGFSIYGGVWAAGLRPQSEEASFRFYSSSTVVEITSSSVVVPSFMRSIPDRRRVHIPSFAA